MHRLQGLHPSASDRLTNERNTQLFNFTRYAMFDDVDQVIETQVVGRESGPRISILIASDHRGEGVVELIDRIAAHVRAQFDYDVLSSIS